MSPTASPPAQAENYGNRPPAPAASDMPVHTRSYGSRALTHKSDIAKLLFSIIEEKKTNLCVSVDVTDPEEALKIIETLGPKICLVKTHIDIISFPPSPTAVTDWTTRLTALSETHNFLIFEDRKFADIGSTVQNQYRNGVFRIADWAHITNAHSFPGPGIVDGLVKSMKEVEAEKAAKGETGARTKRALLLLAEMSSKGNLSGEGRYREKTLKMAREIPGYVVGFIAQSRKMFDEWPRLDTREDFILMTPGVNLGTSGDSLGQQYRTPAEVILQDGADVIIVGRGIYGKEDMVAAAEEYRKAGWEAYLKRITS